jgi:hypothetical protein
MKREGLIKRLEAGKASVYKYSKNGLNGMVNIWKYNNDYIITWEECEGENHWNESAYTKDERYKLPNVAEVMSFIDEHSLDIDNFKP